MNLNCARTATSASLILLCLVSFSSSATVTVTAADKQQINALFDRWNDVFANPSEAQPQTLYADQVEWYGQSMTAQQVIASEQVFVKKTKGMSRRSLVSSPFRL